MLEILGLGALAFGIGLSGALSPGPLTVLAIREAPRRGWWAGPLATLGHGAVELALVVALALGLAAFVEDGPAMAVIAFAGGGLLLWMGWRQLRDAPRASLRTELQAGRAGADGMAGGLAGGAAGGGSRVAAVVAVAPLGALVSVANPYWVVWWATVGTKLTADSLAAGWPGPAAVFAGHILSDLAWLSIVAGLVASGSRRLSGEGWYRWLLGGCAVFLIAIGALFVAGGVRFLG